jgi:hypothetical protein
MNAYSGAIPGKPLMDHSGAGQGAGMAADALIHSWGGQLFHKYPFNRA